MMDFRGGFIEQGPPIGLQSYVSSAGFLSFFWGTQGLNRGKNKPTLFDKRVNASLKTPNEWQTKGAVWGVRPVRDGCTPKVEKTVERDRISRGVPFNGGTQLPVCVNRRLDKESSWLT